MNHKEQTGCGCDHCVPADSRRDFIRKMALSGSLLSGIPQMNSMFAAEQNRDKEWERSKVLSNGKASRITLLHTADIHAQLYTHDEFFWENGRAVYKKRGGFATLKTMLHTLKKQNPVLVPNGPTMAASLSHNGPRLAP